MIEGKEGNSSTDSTSSGKEVESSAMSKG